MTRQNPYPYPYPNRTRPASGVRHVPGQPTVVFDTVLTKHRTRWLADPAIHELLANVWRDKADWQVGHYVLLPNHLHYLALADQPRYTFDRWVRIWKMSFKKRLARPDLRLLVNHWDYRVRTPRELLIRRNYIITNPEKHRLVADWRTWPYGGVVYDWWDDVWEGLGGTTTDGLVRTPPPPSAST